MRTRQVLFIQGGGADAHDAWDSKLVDSLEAGLGDGFEVRYPRMPREDDPSAPTWGPVIRHEMAELDDGAVVVGHSVGGTLLIHVVSEEPPARRLGAIVLLAAPYVGAGGWPSDQFALPSDVGSRLPAGVPVLLFHGLADDTAPAAHLDLYARAIPQAVAHRLPGRDHQLNDDLGEVAASIRALTGVDRPERLTARKEVGQ